MSNLIDARRRRKPAPLALFDAADARERLNLPRVARRLAARFGLSAPRAKTIASLAFGEPEGER